ncbi:MAG: RnfABCDGE type electron transport complex subunit D [Gammaproteobacteria bacterium]|nr:RnfABCDGE type electron transport complex subunit D [Gammaproteobacteria bacterium]
MSSPFLHSGRTVTRLMFGVVVALLPGLAASIYWQGWGVLWQIALALAAAVACESVALRLRRLPLAFTLKDGSVIVLALLLALAMPPLAPWWLSLCATGFAVLLAKHAFGGLGQNPFNPAMAGIVFALLCFPRQMNEWPALTVPALTVAGSIDALHAVLDGRPIDALSGATLLEHTRGEARRMVMVSEMAGAPVFGAIGGRGQEWINLAFLIGGLYLVVQRIVSWRIPCGVLAGVALAATVLYGVDDERYFPAPLHLFSGATMLGAFFVATDPVTAATTPRGQLWYGFGVGVLIVAARCWGRYPDGVAIAVILMNALAPLLDRWTRPVRFGEK